jgi:hypothetical protein
VFYLHRQLSLIVVLFITALIVNSAEIPLIEDGQIRCSIVLRQDAGKVEKHAANELAYFLAKITGSQAPKIGTDTEQGMNPVRLRITKNEAVKDDGFMIEVTKAGVEISARKPLGILYGVYEILKKYGGIMWLTPGEEGEYFTRKATIALPEQKTIINPSFEYRSLSFHGMGVLSPIWDTWDWMLRNNLRINCYPFQISNKGLHAGLIKRGVTTRIEPGFSNLLTGHSYGKKHREQLKKLFETNPELFPIINGKRVFLDGQKYQPCTSIAYQRMSDNAANVFMPQAGKDGFLFLYNNDGTGWCACETCQKIDSDFDKKNGFVTNRYWALANHIAAKAFKKNPDAQIYGMCYQTFQAPPQGVIPDKRLRVNISYNRICYRHKMDDPKCLTNRLFNKYFNGWQAMGNKVVCREEASPAGKNFMPIDETYVHLIKYYKKHGFVGTEIAIAAPDGQYSKRRKKMKNQWFGMWQTMYLHAAYLWDVNQNYKKLYDRINSLYYGKGWDGGMRDFRKLLIKAASETPGCFGHGHSAPLGRCLDQAKVHEQLLKYIAAAENAAKDDPDPRALKHVQYDRKLFASTWEKFRKNYLTNYREVRAYRRTAPIKIDGKLDDVDWKNADIISNFKTTNHASPQKADPQTYVRVVYEPENIYFAIEALEPEPGKILAEVTKHDGTVYHDNTMEIFLNHPDLADAYYQIIINSIGTIFDHFVAPGSPSDKSFTSHAEVKTAILNDRWVLEARIPTASLGEKCMDGQMWKVNILRNRQLTDGTSQGSTWSSGSGHNVDLFHPVVFSRSRAVAKASLREIDSRHWKNGSFTDVYSTSKLPDKWTITNSLLPKDWDLSSSGGELEIVKQKNAEENYYVKLKRGFILQAYGATWDTVADKKFKINFRASGKGTLDVLVLLYKKKPYTFLRSETIKRIDIDSQDWQYYKLEYTQGEADVRIALGMRCNSGEINLDDISFVGLEDNK